MQSADETIRVVVVDDTATWRTVLSRIVRGERDLELIGSAKDGREAVEVIGRLRPDVVTLDVEMPHLNGHEVLAALKDQDVRPRVIMLSSLTDRGTRATMDALALGAVDFICKPKVSSPMEGLDVLRRELLPRIRVQSKPMGTVTWKRIDVSKPVGAAAPAAATPAPAPTGSPSAAPTSTSTPPKTTAPAPAAPKSPKSHVPPAARPSTSKFDAVVFGVSTGGPQSLQHVIPKLPANFPVPVLLVQHMPPKFTATLAADLDRMSELEVVEGEQGMEIKPGRVIIAPGGRHMTVPPEPAPLTVHIDDDPPVEACRPAVEKLFASAATRWGARQLVVMMTGMGHDGQAGCTRYHELGAPIICQSEESCVVFGMPRLPVERGQADAVVHLDHIADELVQRLRVPGVGMAA